MSYIFTISTKDGKFKNPAERAAFLQMCAYDRENGKKEVYMRIYKTRPTTDRLHTFFFVQVGYIVCQNLNNMNYTKSDIEMTKDYLVEEFFPEVIEKPKRELLRTKWGDRKLNKVRKSIAGASREQLKELVDNVDNWGKDNGYKMPDSQEFHELAKNPPKDKKHKTMSGEEYAKQYMKDVLAKFIHARNQKSYEH